MSAECFWCSDTYGSAYHPTCDHPTCDNQVHGFGPEGKRVKSYCSDCREGSA